WASAPPPDGYVFDVELKSSGSAVWTSLESGTSVPGETFTPSVSGPSALRSRLRSVNGGPDSNWSPTVTLRGDWPMYRYNQRHSGVTADPTIGASNASERTVKWETHHAPAMRWSSPAVAFNSTLHKPLVFSG